MKQLNTNKTKKLQKKQKYTAPKLQLTKYVSLDDFEVKGNVTYSALIYGYSTSHLYSFASNSDARTLSIATCFANSNEFTKMASMFINYKILSASMILTPLIPNSSNALPSLYLGLEYLESSTSNPTNSDFILKDQNKIIGPFGRVPVGYTFGFSNVGLLNLWTDTQTLPGVGVFIIGNQYDTSFFSSNIIVFDIAVNFLCSFRGMK